MRNPAPVVTLCQLWPRRSGQPGFSGKFGSSRFLVRANDGAGAGGAPFLLQIMETAETIQPLQKREDVR